MDTPSLRGVPAQQPIQRPAPDLATEHIRLMESRIEQQIAAIERAKLAGEDTSDARHRLNLLCRALAEMRIQLDSLSPTEMDAKRPNEVALAILSGSRKVR